MPTGFNSFLGLLLWHTFLSGKDLVSSLISGLATIGRVELQSPIPAVSLSTPSGVLPSTVANLLNN